MNTHWLNIRGKLTSIDRPWVMGILNITGDSFYQKETIPDAANAVKKAAQMLSDGADILDIGGQSTRPGAQKLSVEEEKKRVLPVIENIVSHFPDAVISIDTFYASVAKEAVATGAAIVNDISAGRMDNDMIPTVTALRVPYILMHMQGEPQTMQQTPFYTDVVGEVIRFLNERLQFLRRAGICDIIVDPGFGFGKNRQHNVTLLRQLDALKVLGCPILVGLSRKKMIQLSTGVSSPDEALAGTITANTMALCAGATFLRVHDVKEAVQTVKLYSEWEKSEGEHTIVP